MKNVVFVVIVAFVVCGSVFGETTITSSAVQVTEQLQIMQGQGFGQASSVAGGGEALSSSSAQGGAGGEGGSAGLNLHFAPTTTNLTRYPDQKTPLPGGIGFAPLPIYPPQGTPVYDNESVTALRELCREYTREEADKVLREHGIYRRSYKAFGELKGYRWKSILKTSNPRLNSTRLEVSEIRGRNQNGDERVLLQGSITSERLDKDFTHLGEIPVSASKPRAVPILEVPLSFLGLAPERERGHQRLALYLALRIAMDEGVDVVLLKQGMNPILSGSTFSPGGGAGHAAAKYSIVAVGGSSSSEMKGTAEPVVILGAYKQNIPDPPAAPDRKPLRQPPTTMPARRGRVPQPPTTRPPAEDPKKLPPEVISPPQSNASPKDSWTWGIQTSDEARRRASDMGIEEVMRMSPSFR